MLKALAPASLALAGALAGCATASAPPPAAVTFARTDCADKPDLSKAVSLTPPKEKAAFTVTSPLAAEAACQRLPQGARPYVLYALPADIADKTITAGAVVEQARILSPEVLLLDRQGAVVRTFTAANYFFRGAVYSVQFRPREGEAYVMVRADPERIGQRYESVMIGTSTTSLYVSPGYMANYTAGVDRKEARTFSYVGTAQVNVYDEDVEEKP